MQNELFKQALGRVLGSNRLVAISHTDATDKVVSYLKENPGSDGIDIAIGAGVFIETVYNILGKVAERRHISGLRFGYFLITE